MTEADLDQIDFARPVTLYSQTTKSTAGFYRMKQLIEARIAAAGGDLTTFDANDSICRQVSNREPALAKFAEQHDVIIFVSGRKSSNGKACLKSCTRPTRAATSWKTSRSWTRTGSWKPPPSASAGPPARPCGSCSASPTALPKSASR